MDNATQIGGKEIIEIDGFLESLTNAIRGNSSEHYVIIVNPGPNEFMFTDSNSKRIYRTPGAAKTAVTTTIHSLLNNAEYYNQYRDKILETRKYDTLPIYEAVRLAGFSFPRYTDAFTKWCSAVSKEICKLLIENNIIEIRKFN